VVLLFVVAMSLFFMIKAYKEGIKVGLDKKKMHKAITSSATFTILPSVSILIGVIALSQKLGLPISWLRLSVIGALQYESLAAKMASERLGVPFSIEGMAANGGSPFVAVILVMTISILSGAIFCLFGLKKYQNSIVNKVGSKDNRWGNIMFNALFIGMVCAFIGVAFSNLQGGATDDGNPTWLSLIVLVASALIMALFSWLKNRKGQKWLENFDFSLAMLLGMGSAVVAGLLGVM
ncbi:MAG: DUF5058 family protein, partial [Clostridiales bacterium]|nr:DUF5058 family protein [Clostridiales bacterium]